MPKEIFWEIHPRRENDFFIEGTYQTVRFRRPQLIKVEDIVSIFRENLQQNWWWAGPIAIKEEEVLEQTEEEPAPILPGEKVLSIRKTYSFPLNIAGVKCIEESFFCITHNIPLKEKSTMGSCTWRIFTQPLTGIELKISNDWWDWKWLHSKKNKNEKKAIFDIANSLYWYFKEWINNGGLTNQLTKKGYNLTPQFDPSWTSCVVEDQCQECGEIHASLPCKLNEVKVGEISKNYCFCRWKRDYRYSSAIERTFKIIGAYPISPIEADCASCEGAVQADSAD